MRFILSSFEFYCRWLAVHHCAYERIVNFFFFWQMIHFDSIRYSRTILAVAYIFRWIVVVVVVILSSTSVDLTHSTRSIISSGMGKWNPSHYGEHARGAHTPQERRDKSSQV